MIDKFLAEGKLSSVTAADKERQREILQRPLSPRTVRYRKLKDRKEEAESSKETNSIIEVRVA